MSDSNVSAYSQTTLAAAQANVQAATVSQVANLNEQLKQNYLTAFNNWLTNWMSERITDKSTAPTPPNAYVVGYFNDPTTGTGSLGPYSGMIVQWAYPAIGTAPVCAQPPIPDIPQPPANLVPGHVHVGVRLGGPGSNYFQKPADDTIATGGHPVAATSDDGVVGMFLPLASEMGTSNPYLGWYLKVG